MEGVWVFKMRDWTTVVFKDYGKNLYVLIVYCIFLEQSVIYLLLLLCRFDIHLVEMSASAISMNLNNKQIRKQNPNTQKEIENLRSKISKMKKSVKTIISL